jgi:hypothetical protein
VTAQDTPAPPRHKRASRRSGRIWHALTGFLGTVLGLAPHVLHHIGLLAGTALVAGSGGTAVFGALGLLASVPLLLRLRRRFGTWKAPALGLAAFVVMFVLSGFVIGPAINGELNFPSNDAPPADHDSHH